MIHSSAPGKLFISGEWAVLEGYQGLVAAVNKRVHSIIEAVSGTYISIYIDDFHLRDIRATFDGRKLVFRAMDDNLKDKLKFIKESIEVALRYSNDCGVKTGGFRIRTWGEETNIEVDGEIKKVGFGSSAAATVAVVHSILAFYNVKASKETIYKLATIAHYYAQGKVGSAFDVAASTYGGLFTYKRFDANWLTKEIDTGNTMKHITENKWPGFDVRELKVPRDLHLLIGWTRSPASTANLVKQMDTFKTNQPDDYKAMMSEIANIARDATDSLNNNEKFLEHLRKNEQALARLGNASGVPIETQELKKLTEIANRFGGAGKLSGAGGGDCGIAVCFDDDTAKKILNEWNNRGIIPLDATIDNEGVRQE